jgi:hypothetical protein
MNLWDARGGYDHATAAEPEQAARKRPNVGKPTTCPRIRHPYRSLFSPTHQRSIRNHSPMSLINAL